MLEQVTIRPTDPERDRAARAEVVRRSWAVAYRDIFSRREIERIFDGSLSLAGDWTARRSGAAGTLVAELAGQVIGVSSMGLMESGVGELAALYVVPEHQGRGVGARLWQASMCALRERGCTSVEVWTLTRADAWRFYEAQGCARLGEGVLRVGDHLEPVAGYRLDVTTPPAEARPAGPDLPQGHHGIAPGG